MSWIRRVAAAPFVKYNALLDRHPLSVKSVTSGCLYASGDILAQYVENYNENKAMPDWEKTELVLDYERTGVVFLFGALIGGPSFHYWYNGLDKLPALLCRMKQTRQIGILRSSVFPKSQGVEVGLNMAGLPKAKPLTKWEGRAAMIAADTLVFSSLYTLVFFMSIGVLSDTASLLSGDAVATPEREQERNLTWSDIWRRSWQHTKEVYLKTYLCDCIVWPPLQLINFTFVPLRFQFLYVNLGNIGWNTFLSFMANKKH